MEILNWWIPLVRTENRTYKWLALSLPTLPFPLQTLNYVWHLSDLASFLADWEARRKVRNVRETKRETQWESEACVGGADTLHRLSVDVLSQLLKPKVRAQNRINYLELTTLWKCGSMVTVNTYALSNQLGVGEWGGVWIYCRKSILIFTISKHENKKSLQTQ